MEIMAFGSMPLIVLLYIGLFVLFLVLAWRFVRAQERMARALEKLANHIALEEKKNAY